MAIDHRNPEPLYRQIVADLRSRIQCGELKVNEQVGSHQELCRQYEVSLITVKRALAELIQEGVLYSRVGKGTFVASKSPFVLHTKHQTLGVVLSDLTSPFFSLIIESFEETAHDLGYNILLSTSSDRVDKEETQIRRFMDIGVDGLLIASMSHVYRATPTVRRLHEDSFPYVMVSYVDDDDVYYVGTDNEQGAFMATEHLLKLGYRRVGYISGEMGNLLGDLRQRGYTKALQAFDIPFDPGLVYRLRDKWNGYGSGFEIGRSFLASSDRPDAVFVYNDLSALGFEKAILDGGLRVPEDIAIVGFDNIKRCVVASVALTTVHQPTRRIGQIAFEVLNARMQRSVVAPRTILAPELVVRQSCGARQQGYPEVNQGERSSGF